MRAIGLVAATGPGLAARRSRGALVVTGFASDSRPVKFAVEKRVPFGSRVAVLGAAEELGQWDPTGAVALKWSEGDVWTTQAEVPVGSVLEYKYIVVKGDAGSAAVLEWQPGGNLSLAVPEAPCGELRVRDAWAGGAHEVVVLPAAEPEPAAAAAISALAAEEAAAPEPEPEEEEPEQPAQPAAAVADPVAAAPVAVVEAAAPATPLADTKAETPQEEGAAPPTPAYANNVLAAPAPASGALPLASLLAAYVDAADDAPPAGSAAGAAKPAAVVKSARPPRGGSKLASASVTLDFRSLTVKDLKAQLQERGLPTAGRKSELVARLEATLG